MSKRLTQVAILAAAFGVDIGEALPKPKPPKVKTKYDDERIMENEIRQARKAAKRLAVKESK